MIELDFILYLIYFWIHIGFQLKEKTAEHSYDPSVLEQDPQLKGLMSEVKEWKKEHQK